MARLEALEYVTEAALSTLAADDLLRELLARTRQVLAADTATILLLSDDHQSLTVRASHGLEEEVKARVTIPVGRSFAGRIAATGEPMIVNDLAETEVVSPLLRQRLCSVIGAPLRAHGHLIGVLYAATIHPRRFTNDDLRLLQVVADRAALSIESSQLYEAERRSRLEAEGRARELDAVFRAMSEPLLIWDATGTFVRANPAAVAAYGFDPSGLTREQLARRVNLRTPEGQPMTVERMPVSRVLRGESVLGERMIFTDAHGRDVIIATSGAPLTTNGERQGAVVIWHDVTTQERLLAELQRQAEARASYIDRQNRLLQVSTSVLRETSLQGLLQAVADASRELTGARVAVSGHGYVSGAFRIGAESHAPGAMACPPGQEFKVERGGLYLDLLYERESLRLTDEEMRRDPHWWGLPPDHGPLRGLLGARLVGRNGQPGGLLMVTDREEGDFTPEDEALLRQLAAIASLGLQHVEAREAAEAAVHARDEFLAAAAHELKTPVTNLRGFAQMSLRRLDREGALDPQRIRQTLQTIDLQSDRLARLVNQLLDVASLETGQLVLRPRSVDLAALVQHAVADAQAATRRHTLHLHAPPSVPATVDPARIEQVLANLLDNAAKFSPEGTPIDVDLTTPNSDTVRLTVRDYGRGIPPERRDRLFSRFYQAQTGRPFSGLGLGLYYARQIVELHGGHIEAEFPPEGGTRIVVTLPRAGAVTPGSGASQ